MPDRLQVMTFNGVDHGAHNERPHALPHYPRLIVNCLSEISSAECGWPQFMPISTQIFVSTKHPTRIG